MSENVEAFLLYFLLYLKASLHLFCYPDCLFFLHVMNFFSRIDLSIHLNLNTPRFKQKFNTSGRNLEFMKKKSPGWLFVSFNHIRVTFAVQTVLGVWSLVGLLPCGRRVNAWEKWKNKIKQKHGATFNSNKNFKNWPKTLSVQRYSRPVTP